MRITNRMMTDGALKSLSANVEATQRIQAQVASGKRISKPSDDPAEVRSAVKVREALSQLEQYQRNVDVATRVVTAADGSLGNAGDIIQRARELAIQGANDTNGPTDRRMMAAEVEQLVSGLIQAAGAKVGGRYIFSGFRTGTPPYTQAAPGIASAYQGDANAIQSRIDPSTSMQVNVPGDVAFGDAFAALSQMYAELNAGTAVSASTISAIDQAQDTLLSARATIGTRATRLETTKASLDDSLLAATTLRSQVEDVDITTAITELSQRQLTYEAALKVTGRLLQSSLIDQLR
jgi:flagellar hook-associated protein 3 FlgL